MNATTLVTGISTDLSALDGLSTLLQYVHVFWLPRLQREHADLTRTVESLRAENAALHLALSHDATPSPDGTFGAYLRELRLATGLRQNVLARGAGVDPSHICRVESGEAIPSRALLARIAGALHLSAQEAAELFRHAGYRSGR